MPQNQVRLPDAVEHFLVTGWNQILTDAARRADDLLLEVDLIDISTGGRIDNCDGRRRVLLGRSHWQDRPTRLVPDFCLTKVKVTEDPDDVSTGKVATSCDIPYWIP